MLERYNTSSTTKEMYHVLGMKSFHINAMHRFLSAFFYLLLFALKSMAFSYNIYPKPSYLFTFNFAAKTSNGISHPYGTQPKTKLFSTSDDGNSNDDSQDLQKSATFSGGDISFHVHSAIADIPSEAWDSCLGNNVTKNDCSTIRSPFLEHAWLRCLEESGCASESTGWIPQHVSIQIKCNDSNDAASKGDIQKATTCSEEAEAGFVPVYIKTHSMGEFIFDDSWADAACRNGMDYYPKILVGVPFTPVTGPRLLWKPWVWHTFSKDQIAELCNATGNFLKQFAIAKDWSSVHINFCTEEEATILAGPLQDRFSVEETSDPVTEDKSQNPMTKSFQAMLRQIRYKDTDDYLRRTSIQYHWTNTNRLQKGKPYTSFEQYLACFKSKRRITIRRERSTVREDSSIQIDAIRGMDILKVDGLMDRMFDIYLSTVDRMYWGRQYLTREFFELLIQSSFVKNLCFLCARYKTNQNSDINNNDLRWKAEDIFAGTFNVIKDGVFYGRYWGCLPGYETKNLHFEICYWSAIEYCIDNGLKRMEPGAGGAGKFFIIRPGRLMHGLQLTDHSFSSHVSHVSNYSSSIDYKWARGFDPALIHSVHYICHPGMRRAVWQFLDSETKYNVAFSEHFIGRSSVAGTG